MKEIPEKTDKSACSFPITKTTERYCSNCGRVLNEGWAYCSQCENKV